MKINKLYQYEGAWYCAVERGEEGCTPLTDPPHERSCLSAGTARATRSVPVRTKVVSALGHVASYDSQAKAIRNYKLIITTNPVERYPS